MPSSGRLAAVKLVHLYGYESCKTPVGVDNWTYWHGAVVILRCNIRLT